MQPIMTKTEFIDQINQQVDRAIADGYSAHGTDEFLEQSILDELGNTQLPESTSALLAGLLVVFGIRRRQFLADHPAH